MLIAFARTAYGQAADRPASIVGIVRNEQHVPVAGVSVSLESIDAKQIQTGTTDAQGAYRFTSVTPGRYTLQASIVGFEETSINAVNIEPGDQKTIDLKLNKRSASEQAIPKSPAVPVFSDDPNFTVAGVADTSNLGGHGSDVVVRNREALAKATASLGTQPSPPSESPALSSVDEKSLRAAIERDGTSYEANYKLGKALVDKGKPKEAIPYLERASQTKPGAYEDEYELALAHCAAEDYQVAAAKAQDLLANQDRAEVRHLLGEVEEKLNNPLEAVRQYQRAAELDPSETNYFDWGAELLLHQAAEPAVEVFSKGSRLFPDSLRMLSALGAAWYVSGSNDRAVETLCRASDLDPNATEPYMFLGRIQNAETAGNAEIANRLARFAKLQPANALANYYYAVSLWKHRKGPEDIENLPLIESLLRKALSIDPKLAAAHSQLGALYFERKDFPAAIAAYRKAVESAPDLPDAHYRLAQAYRQAGEKVAAQQEFQLYQQTSKKAAEQVERERHEVRQFIYTLRNQNAGSSAQ